MKKLTKPSLTYLCIALSCTPLIFFYTTVINNFSYQEFINISGSVSGYVGVILMIWSFILGIRSLIGIITPDIIAAINTHKNLGKYGMLLILIHPLLQVIIYLKNFSWLFILDFRNNLETRVSMGRIALLLFLIIYATSALLRNRIKYRPWKLIHLLAYPMLVLVFIHAVSIGSIMSKYPIVMALWFTVFLLYQILIIYKFIEWSGILRPKYTLVSKNYYGDHQIVYCLSPISHFIKPTAGQFIYLQINKFGETHPFSILDYSKKDNIIKIGVKTVGKFTTKMERLAIGTPIGVEGPYGVFGKDIDLQANNIFIAGGVGVVPCLNILNEQDNSSNYLIYSVRNIDEIINYNQIQKILPNQHLITITKEDKVEDKTLIDGARIGRINSNLINEIVNKNNNGKKNIYYVCGSTSFIKGVLEYFKELKIDKKYINVEEYAY